MSRLTLNDELGKLLQNVTEPVELCDSAGNLLGRFVPKFDASKYECLTPEITEEELQRRLESNEKRYSTAEVIAHLERL